MVTTGPNLYSCSVFGADNIEDVTIKIKQTTKQGVSYFPDEEIFVDFNDGVTCTFVLDNDEHMYRFGSRSGAWNNPATYTIRNEQENTFWNENHDVTEILFVAPVNVIIATATSTVEDGRSSTTQLNYTEGHNRNSLVPGHSYTIRANYEENEEYKSAGGVGVLEMLRCHTTPTLTTNKSTVSIGSSITFTFEVRENINQTRLTSGTWSLYEGGVLLQSNIAVTGASTSFDYVPESLGVHEYHAVYYSGSNEYNDSTSNKVQVSVEVIQTHINILDGSPEEYVLPTDITFDAILFDDNDEQINTSGVRRVTLQTHSGMTVYEGNWNDGLTTIPAGNITWNTDLYYSPPEGNYKLIVSYDGEEGTYSSSTATAEFNVPRKVQMTPLTVKNVTSNTKDIDLFLVDDETKTSFEQGEIYFPDLEDSVRSRLEEDKTDATKYKLRFPNGEVQDVNFVYNLMFRLVDYDYDGIYTLSTKGSKYTEARTWQILIQNQTVTSITPITHDMNEALAIYQEISNGTYTPPITPTAYLIPSQDPAGIIIHDQELQISHPIMNEDWEEYQCLALVETTNQFSWQIPAYTVFIDNDGSILETETIGGATLNEKEYLVIGIPEDVPDAISWLCDTNNRIEITNIIDANGNNMLDAVDTNLVFEDLTT